MGLFGGTKVYVSSVVYNLAGDPLERPNYLKTAVLSGVYGSSKFSVSETLQRSYASGPGMKVRAFHRWARQPGNYDAIGISTSAVRDESDLNPYVAIPHLPLSSPSNYATVANFRYGKCDFTYWADQYMLNNHPSVFGEAWAADYDAGTNQITITRPAGAGTFVFTPADYDPTAYYFYVMYNERRTSDNAWQATKMWIYRQGAGIADLDELVVGADTSDEFVPFIPIRIENQFLSGSYMPEAYAQAKKAYKKLTDGGKFDELVAKIADNPSLGDIDHAYVVPGVALNTKTREGLRYIFEFFAMMTEMSPTSTGQYAAYQAAMSSYEAAYQAWKDSRPTWADEHPGVPFPPPPAKPAVLLPTTSVTIVSSGSTDAKLNMTVKWRSAEKLTGTGLGKPGAKVGDLWWAPVSYNNGELVGVELSGTILTRFYTPDPVVTLYWQKSETSWEAYRVIGLQHINDIYWDKAVEISAAEALMDDDESGFILPLHYDTLKAMSLVDSTQLMLAGRYLVFNCYKVVKQKWYQTGIFKIVLFVAVIVIAVATGGIGAGSVGLLGSAGAVGAAIGLTGVLAIIVGAIANAIAAMILSAILTKVSALVFGDKLGALIGAVASVAALSIGTGLMNGQSMSSIWSGMGSATNLINLTSAVGSGITGYVSASIEEIQAKMVEFNKEMDARMKEVRDLYAKNIGYDNGVLDPMGLTDTQFGNLMESPFQFFSRTLLTGSDIANISLGMIEGFAELTTKLDLPLTG